MEATIKSTLRLSDNVIPPMIDVCLLCIYARDARQKNIGNITASFLTPQLYNVFPGPAGKLLTLRVRTCFDSIDTTV